MIYDNKKVMVLILTCDQLEYTGDCLESLKQSDYPDLEIVVVDNGSTDGTYEALSSSYPEITLLRNDKNLGCAGGRNTGVRYFLEKSDSKYLFFLDNDTVMAENAISELVSLVEKDKDTGIAAPFWFYYDDPDVLYFGGGALINWKKGVFHGSMQDEKFSGEEIVREVDSVPGGIIFARREAVKKARLFDERYFIYFEDPDWEMRVRKAGYKIVATSNAKIWHKVSKSMGRESPLFYYYRTRNRLLFMKKNASAINRVYFFFYYLYELTAETLPTLVLNKMYGQLKAVFAGIYDYVLGRYGKKEGI